jgi:hypothetical protein
MEPIEQMLAQADEAEDYLRDARHELDALWRSARDATEPGGGAFDPGTNREVADAAAYRILQSLHMAEEHLARIRGAARQP